MTDKRHILDRIRGRSPYELEGILEELYHEIKRLGGFPTGWKLEKRQFSDKHHKECKDRIMKDKRSAGDHWHEKLTCMKCGEVIEHSSDG